MTHLNDISKVYLDQVSESAVPGKPAEKLGAVTAIPKSEQEAARERTLAKAKAKRDKMKTEALDPVGQEDDDIDNDGDSDKSDKYLLKRRKAIGKAIAKKKVEESSHYDPMDDDDFDHDEAEENRGVSGKNNPKGGKTLGKKKKDVKEGFSNWRQDLSEVMTNVDSNGKIKEKKVNNKIKINPDMKETVEKLGGELIEMVELDEKAYRGLGVGRVERVSSGSYQAPETTGSAAKRTPKPTPEAKKPVETKKPAALPPEQGRRAKKRRKGSPSYAEVKAQIDAKEKSRKPKRTRRSRLDSLLASIRNEEVHQIDELSVNKMLAYMKKAEKNRESLNKKWDQGTATPKERKKVFDREEGETRASDKIEKKTGKRPYEMNAIDRLRAATRNEETRLDEAVYGGTPVKKEEPKDTRYTVTAADKKGNTAAYQKYKSGDKRYKAAPHLGEETLDEKALSKQQQKFMGMVYAVKKGEMKAPSPEVAKAAAGMTKQQAKDFAKTKHKGLPQVKEDTINEREHDEPGEGPRQKYGDMRGIDRSGPPTSFGGKWQSKERKAAGAAALAKMNKKVEESVDEIPMTPQELNLQKKKSAIDIMIAKRRQQAILKNKNQQKF